jgi:multiple sugar transport system substrate-binding protein
VKRALAAWVLLLVLNGCAGSGSETRTTIRFWGMGREGEVVSDLARDFERENPDVKVVVQQIPWSAAHAKLLTAHVGRSLPDCFQLGNTWVAEFTALHAIDPLTSWVAASKAIDPNDQFPGVWDTNVMGGTVYGVPWYVDTRVLFYRKDILARAGYDSIPQTWSEWRRAMQAVKKVVGADRYAILLPANEWTQPVIFGLQNGATLLSDHDTRADFENPAFEQAFGFFLGLFRDGLAPPVTNNEIANVYQEFERGTFAMYITGPWNVGEFRSRLAPEHQGTWTTAPLPGPSGAASGVSLAGGSSLVLSRASKHKQEAWRFIEYLCRPDVQARFTHLTGDLPARPSVWADTAITKEPALVAFKMQLERVVSTPKLPEWEEIANRLQDQAEGPIRGKVPADSALARLDRDVNAMLEKRRWLLEHGKLAAAR